jgi:hypothetical protein
MNTSFVASSRPATPVMKRGGRNVNCAVSASVECFVCERAPTPHSRLASLSRRLPPMAVREVLAVVDVPSSRLGHSRRGSTSEIPDRSLLGSASGWRALVAAARAHSVRPNYAFERTVMRRRHCSGVRRAAAQRER